MGQPKGGGYTKKQTLDQGQSQLLQLLSQLSGQNLQSGGNLSQSPLYQQAVQGTQQFLPGGQGFAPIQAEAQRQYQQETLPAIMNAFGSDARSSSALNQALASSGANLNTSLAAQLAQMQLGASQQAAGLAGLPFQQGLQGANLGLGTPSFAYLQRPTPFYQSATLAGLGAGGQLGGAYLGRSPGFNLGGAK